MIYSRECEGMLGGGPVSEIEPTVSDEFEKKFVTEFLAKSCGCKSWNNKPCSFQFSSDYITEVRSYCASLAREELEMVIHGQIMALSNLSEITYNKNPYTTKEINQVFSL